MNEKNETNEIDLLQLVSALLKKWWLIAVATVLAGVIAFGYTYLYVKPTYKASALFYVNNTSISAVSGKISFSATDLTAAKSLVDTYQVILGSRLCLEEVITKGNYNYSYAGLKGMISASSVNETEIFSVTVTALNPEEACDIANTIADVLPGKIATVMDGASVKVVDYAVVPTARSSPSYKRNTMIGMIFGFIIAAAGIVVAELLNDSVKSEAWLTNTFGSEIPLLAIVPHEGTSGKHGRYGKYAKYGGYGSYETKNKQE